MDERLTDALEILAKTVLGRDDLDRRTLGNTAGRLSGLAERLREVDAALVRDIPPAFAFQPAHDAYAVDVEIPLDTVDSETSRYTGTGYAPPVGSAEDRQQEGTAPPDERNRPQPVMAEDEMGRLSLAEQAAAVKRGELRAVELVERAVRQAEALNPQLNAFITITAEAAVATARDVDRRLAAGEDVGPLYGVPYASKDVCFTAGVPTTAAVSFLADHVPAKDATVVQRLRSGGAISIGKTNLHQFAFGATSESSHIGPTRNPLDLRRSPGGSSGGSAAAIAANIVAMTLGSDTGGSIRIPAAACGVFGLKATYGRISKAGVFPLSWSMDHVGPLTATVADAALVLNVLAGVDADDPTTVPVPAADYGAAAEKGRRQDVRGLRVGILVDWLDDRVDPGVQAAVHDAGSVLQQMGAEVRECSLMPVDFMMLINRLIVLGDAGAFHGPLLARHAEAYSRDVRARVELGQFLLARDYLLAQRLRTEITRRTNELLKQVDVLLVPTLPSGAPWLGQRKFTWPSGDESVPDAMIRLTGPFNVTGHPVGSVPWGAATDGMPASVQVVGRTFDEATVLQVAAALEAARTP